MDFMLLSFINDITLHKREPIHPIKFDDDIRFMRQLLYVAIGM